MPMSVPIEREATSSGSLNVRLCGFTSRVKKKMAHARVEVVRFLHVADVSRPRDHSKFRIGNCGMKLFGDTKRAASIAFTPKKQRRNLDGGQRGGGVSVSERFGHQSEPQWVEVRHDGRHL